MHLICQNPWAQSDVLWLAKDLLFSSGISPSPNSFSELEFVPHTVSSFMLAGVPWAPLPFALATLSTGWGRPTAHTTSYAISLLLWPQTSGASISLFGQQKLSTYFRSAISKWVLIVKLLTPRNILHSLVPEPPSSQSLRVWSADWIMVKYSLTSLASQAALVV